MTKNEMISKVKEQFGYDENFSEKIITIFENCSEIGSKGKEKVISHYMKELEVNETEAVNIFEYVFNLVKKGVMDKLKNPFSKK